MEGMKAAMLLLIANEEPLPPEYFDHDLKGDWQGYRECHIGGDFLLVYRIDTSTKPETVYFTRAGTHAELFE